MSSLTENLILLNRKGFRTAKEMLGKIQKKVVFFLRMRLSQLKSRTRELLIWSFCSLWPQTMTKWSRSQRNTRI